MRLLPFLLAALLAPAAAAQDLSAQFHCVVKGAHSLDMKGKLVKNMTVRKNLNGQHFTVDRDTGKINAEFYTNNSPTVLWNAPSDDSATAYLAEDVVVGRSGAVFSIFQILRNESKNLRPFVWHLQTVTITGMCK